MNKKGNVYAAVMVAIIVFIVGLSIVNFIKPEVTTTYTQLNCIDETAISDGTKAMCLVVDFGVPYFIVLVLSLAAGVITDKLLI